MTVFPGGKEIQKTFKSLRNSWTNNSAYVKPFDASCKLPTKEPSHSTVITPGPARNIALAVPTATSVGEGIYLPESDSKSRPSISSVWNGHARFLSFSKIPVNLKMRPAISISSSSTCRILCNPSSTKLASTAAAVTYREDVLESGF